MECACIDVDDGDSPEFHKVKTRVAKKEYKCSECGRDIVPGETYEYVSGKWDGDFLVYKTCGDCISAREAFFCGGGWYYGDVWESIKEYSADYGEECLSKIMLKITPEARGKISEILEANNAHRVNR